MKDYHEVALMHDLLKRLALEHEPLLRPELCPEKFVGLVLHQQK